MFTLGWRGLSAEDRVEPYPPKLPQTGVKDHGHTDGKKPWEHPNFHYKIFTCPSFLAQQFVVELRKLASVYGLSLLHPLPPH
jgi:hypothetical protein